MAAAPGGDLLGPLQIRLAKAELATIAAVPRQLLVEAGVGQGDQPPRVNQEPLVLDQPGPEPPGRQVAGGDPTHDGMAS